MKIIKSDNFNRDYQPEFIYMIDLGEEEAKVLVKKLNQAGGDNSPEFYKVVSDEYTPNFESQYDLVGEVPTYSTFCKYTGVDKLGDIQGTLFYLQQFHKDLDSVMLSKKSITELEYAIELFRKEIELRG